MTLENNAKTTRPYLAAHQWRSYSTFLSRNPRFKKFWLTGVVSQLGNWFNYIAIFVLLTRLTGSGDAISWFLIAKFIPTSFLGPAAGVIADRFSRKTILIFCDLARALLVLCFLLVRSPEQVWLIYLLALIQESLWTFYDPARRASVPNLCSSDELNLANALSGATWSVMLAIGAALGGFITSLFGWQTAIVLDALSFLISAWMLVSIDIPEERLPAVDRPTWRDYTGLRDIVDGCRYLLGDSRVAFLLLVKSGWALSGGVLVLLTVFGEQVFAGSGAAGSGSGILYSFRGIGAAIGPLLAWRLFSETTHGMYRAIGIAFFVSAGAYLAFSQAPGLWWAAPFVLAGHIGGSVQWVFSTTLLQRLIPNRYRGRVFAAEMALLTFILSLSTYFTGAALAKGSDPRNICIVLALLFIVPGMTWTLYVWIQKGLRGEVKGSRLKKGNDLF